VLPEIVTEDAQDFLLGCLQKEVHKRPDAKALLRHAWLRQRLSQNLPLDLTIKASLCRMRPTAAGECDRRHTVLPAGVLAEGST